MKKKFITFLLATFFATSLVGCGNSSNNSSIANVNVETVENDYISVNYPSDKWEVLDIADYDEYIPLILSYTLETEYDSSISVTTLETTDDLETILEDFESSLPTIGGSVEEAEIRNIGSREASYIEYSMSSFDEGVTAVSIGVLDNGKIAMIQAFVAETGREDILEAMNIMAETIKIK